MAIAGGERIADGLVVCSANIQQAIVAQGSVCFVDDFARTPLIAECPCHAVQPVSRIESAAGVDVGKDNALCGCP